LGWGILFGGLYLVAAAVIEDATGMDPEKGGMAALVLNGPPLCMIAGSMVLSSLHSAARHGYLRIALPILLGGLAAVALGVGVPLIASGIVRLHVPQDSQWLDDLSALACWALLAWGAWRLSGKPPEE
jgi:hypothetical protein